MRVHDIDQRGGDVFVVPYQLPVIVDIAIGTSPQHLDTLALQADKDGNHRLGPAWPLGQRLLSIEHTLHFLAAHNRDSGFVYPQLHKWTRKLTGFGLLAERAEKNDTFDIRCMCFHAHEFIETSAQHEVKKSDQVF